MATKAQKAEQAEAVERLRGWLKPGDTVHTILDHVSRSGMLREIRVVLLSTQNGSGVVDLHPNHAVAKAIGCTQGKRDGLRVTGCGMDMGFHIVSTLSRVLYPNGFGCIGKNCPSNDHANGDRDYTPHKPEGLKPQADHWHNSGDYALRHRWL